MMAVVRACIHLLAPAHDYMYCHLYCYLCCLQTVKYNTKKRAGRGFTFEELRVRHTASWQQQQ